MFIMFGIVVIYFSFTMTDVFVFTVDDILDLNNIHMSFIEFKLNTRLDNGEKQKFL